MRLFILVLLLVCLPAQGAQSLRILLTNDDGFEAPGIRAVRSALIEAGHDVYMVAPATQQSGKSAAVTLRVQVTDHPDRIWAVHGTPADAVRFGLGKVMYDMPPDLVVVGANLGHNTGADLKLSGTVGAALTAAQFGFPSIAISVGIKIEERDRGYPSTIGAFSGASRLLVRLIDNLDPDDLTGALNINYPPLLPLDIRGVRWSNLSDYSLFSRRFHQNKDGSWSPDYQRPDPHARHNDAESLYAGFVTLTMLDGDMSVAVHRNQKYLADHLLDRNYEVETPKKKERSIGKVFRNLVPGGDKPADPVRKPETNPAPAKEVTKQTPAAQAPQLEFPVNEPVAVSDDAETAIDTVPAKVTNEEVAEAVEVVASEEVVTPEQETTPEEQANKKPRKKPDSWLRRIFDPASWRR